MALHEKDIDSGEPEGDSGILSNIRTNVQTFMALRGIKSLEALAAAAGMKKSRIYDRFNGTTPEWKVTELADVARALRVSAGDLLEDPDSNFDPRVRTGSR